MGLVAAGALVPAVAPVVVVVVDGVGRGQLLLSPLQDSETIRLSLPPSTEGRSEWSDLY